MGKEPAFEVRIKSWWCRSALFRVYITGQQLYFIRLGAPKTKAVFHLDATNMFLDVTQVERVTPEVVRMRDQIDGLTPEEMMPLHRRNFIVDLNAIGRVDIDCGQPAQTCCVGHLVIRERSGTKYQAGFESKPQLCRAIEVLKAPLKDRIYVDGSLLKDRPSLASS